MANLNSKLLLDASGEITGWHASLFNSVNVVAAETPSEKMNKPLHESVSPIDDAVDATLVEFASPADGRGFSVAASLRNQGFTGYLIASGELIPDQISMAYQCGYDAVLVTPAQVERYGIDAWQDALRPVVNLSYAPVQSKCITSIWKQRRDLGSSG